MAAWTNIIETNLIMAIKFFCRVKYKTKLNSSRRFLWNLISAVIERCSFKSNGLLRCPVFTSLVFYVIDSSIHGHFGKQLLSPGFLSKGSYAFKVILWKHTPYATWIVALMRQWSLYSLLKSFFFRRRIYRLYHSDRGRRSETPLLPYWLWLISTECAPDNWPSRHVVSLAAWLLSNFSISSGEIKACRSLPSSPNVVWAALAQRHRPLCDVF